MLNKVTLIGRLGNDPEIRYTSNGKSVANISLATSRTWNNKETREKHEETEWHRIVFFGRSAEIVGQYLRKGSLVYIEGRLQTQKWQDKNGQDRYTTEIISEQMKMLDSKSGGTENLSDNPVANDVAIVPVSTSTTNNTKTPNPDSTAEAEDFDDDIPF